ncbi:MAG: 30S ribosomal protein S6 [Clostridia bacterium]|nr:30S ribosomal protein S6 [Clostridia bacterium]
MDKKLQSYETIFVVDVSKGEETVKAVIEKFTSLISANGEITQVNDWGKRRLAYPINDRTEGYYTLIYFQAPPAFASELERLYNINENVLRSIVVKEDLKVRHLAADAPAAPVVNDDEEDEEPAAPAIVEEAAEEPAAEEAAEAETVEETVEEAAEETVEEAEEPAAEETSEEKPADAE